VESRSSAFEALDPIRHNRGWFIALGAALMILGFLAVAVPFAATLVSTMFLGWILVFSGIAEGVHAVRARAWQGFPWAVLRAVLGVVAGILLIAFPIVGTLTLTLVLAGFVTAEGVLKIIRAVQYRGMPRWGFLLFDGLVTLGLGILILAQWPGASLWVLGLLVGIHLLVGGMSMLLLAMSAGRLTRGAV
jgi:uncharacterized membrane protein HdeD (DUF308 family)